MEATQIPLKRKYRAEKPVGRYKGGHNDSMRRRPRRKKGSGKAQHSTACMVMLPNGKTRMVK